MKTKKILIGIVSLLTVSALLGFAANAQSGKFFYRLNDIHQTIVRAYSTPEEFLDDGGQWDEVKNIEQTIGSVGVASEYSATTTIASSAGTFWMAGTGPTTLGSVIVASSSASTFTIWNATSTTDVSSSTFAVIKAAIGEMTLTFDTVLNRGLIIRTPTGFNGNYIITYRK